MKKLMFAIGLGLISGSVYASCLGPYCYDESGATINATTSHSGAMGLPNETAANIRAKTPSATGQMWYCTDCNTLNGGFLCVSTGTTVAAYSLVASTTTRCQ